MYQSIFQQYTNISHVYMCVTRVMFDLSVQTIVLVTVTSCEIHVKKLVPLKVLEFAHSLTLYLPSM